jgi:integrase
LRGLFRWAVNAEFVAADPTNGVNASRPRTEGFRVWTEDEIERFEARWPTRSRERLALAILLYTGLRRGDAVQLGRRHIRDGLIFTIPLLPELAEVIAASKTGDLAFIATTTGTPMTKESLGNWFRDACKAAGVPGSAHGLRKAGATRAANNDATVAQLEAIFGSSGGGMASLYTRRPNAPCKGGYGEAIEGKN